MSEKKRVLFLCVGNSCRSQMAEGLLRDIASENFEAFSAGAETHGLNPRAVKVMDEIGIDVSNHKSQLVSDYEGETFDFVVTVCDNAGNRPCPVFLGNAGKHLHTPFDDPAHATGSEEEILDVFRRVRDEIGIHLRTFVKEVTGAGP